MSGDIIRSGTRPISVMISKQTIFVVAIVQLAREHILELSRGGIAGIGDNTIVIYGMVMYPTAVVMIVHVLCVKTPRDYIDPKIRLMVIINNLGRRTCGWSNGAWSSRTKPLIVSIIGRTIGRVGL